MLARHDGSLWTTIDGRVVLLSMGRGRYYEANTIGRAIWMFLDQPRAMAEIVDHIVSSFRVDRDQCQRDVAAFVEELRTSELIVDADAAPEPGSEATAESR